MPGRGMKGDAMHQPCSADLTILHRRRADMTRRSEVAALLSADHTSYLRPAELLDVWRAAELYLNQHSGLAEFEVAQQVSKLRAAGDREGVEVWVCIYDTISHIRRQIWTATMPPGFEMAVQS